MNRAGDAQHGDDRTHRGVDGLDPRLSADLRARVPLAMERAAQKAQNAAPAPAAAALLAAAQGARTARQRVVWLQRWGDAWIAPLARQAACRRGCSHCCHVAVPVTSAEARLIGEATGRAPAAPQHALTIAQIAAPEAATRWRSIERRAVGSPCPFLSQNGDCSIYERRPFACRLHVSLDDDDLLCRLVPGVDVPVPHANTREAMALFLAAQPTEVLADIREYFAGAGATPARRAPARA